MHNFSIYELLRRVGHPLGRGQKQWNFLLRERRSLYFLKTLKCSISKGTVDIKGCKAFWAVIFPNNTKTFWSFDIVGRMYAIQDSVKTQLNLFPSKLIAPSFLGDHRNSHEKALKWRRGKGYTKKLNKSVFLSKIHSSPIFLNQICKK